MEWGPSEQADGASGEKAERTDLAFGDRIDWQALQRELSARPCIGESHYVTCRRRMKPSGGARGTLYRVAVANHGLRQTRRERVGAAS